MKLTKAYEIFIEGIDKTGKDSLARYIDNYCGHRLCVHSRGMLSTLAYNDLYGRNIEYDLDSMDKSRYLFILLTVNEDDWKVRCKLNNEPAIDYQKNSEAFIRAANFLNRKGFTVTTADTSVNTLHELAKEIIEKVEKLNDVKLLEVL